MKKYRHIFSELETVKNFVDAIKITKDVGAA